MDGEVVSGGDFFHAVFAHRFLCVADISGHIVIGHLGGADVLHQLVLLGQALPARPRGFELLGGFDGGPFILGNDAEEVALAHELDDTGNAADRRLVDALQRRSDRRRPYHAAVQHAGHAEVLHVGEFAGHLVRNVDARDRGADDLEVFRVLGLRRLGVVDRERKGLAADQLAIADGFAAAADGPGGDRELVRLDAELRRREIEQRTSRHRRGVANLHAADLDREAAECRPLIRRQRRVALDDLNPVERHVELVGHDLRQRGAHAGAEIDLAGIDGHHAGGIDGEKGIDRSERHRLGRGGRLRERRARPSEEGEADDERTAALEQVAARSDEIFAHGYLACARPAARWTALTTRAWLPQRHRLPVSAFLMSASLGLRFVARKAAASMIMPLVQ